MKVFLLCLWEGVCSNHILTHNSCVSLKSWVPPTFELDIHGNRKKKIQFVLWRNHILFCRLAACIIILLYKLGLPWRMQHFLQRLFSMCPGWVFPKAPSIISDFCILYFLRCSGLALMLESDGTYLVFQSGRRLDTFDPFLKNKKSTVEVSKVINWTGLFWGWVTY